MAADLTWDATPGGAINDGSGTWLGTNQWNDGSPNASWNNSTPDNAFIGAGGTAGVISLGSVTAGSVTFTNFAGTYVLTNGSLSVSDTITIATNAGPVTLSTPVSGTASITKANTGTLLLIGTNSLTGNISINAGTLQVGGSGFLRNGNYAGNIINNGVLSFTTTAAQTLSGIISGSGSLKSDRATSGTLTLSGLNTYTGPTSFSANLAGNSASLNVSSFDYIATGTYTNHGLGSSLGAPTNVLNGTINIGIGSQTTCTLKYTGAAATGETTDRVLKFTFNGSGSYPRVIDASGSGLLKFTRAFTGSGTGGGLKLDGTGAGEVAAGIGNLYTGLPVTKSGNGTWTFSGTNTFTGLTTINGGTLEIGGAGVLGGGAYSNTIANSAKLHYNSTATQTLSGAISGTGALIKNNTGTLNLTATNTYTGATTISNGTLLVNGSLANASRVAIASGGTLGGLGTVGIVTNNGTLSPGYGTVMGTLTTSNLVLNTGCTNVFDLSGTNANDRVTVNGSLTFNGDPVVVVNMNPVVFGTYPLLEVIGSAPTSSVPTLSFNSGTSGAAGKLSWDVDENKTLLMNISPSGTMLIIQ